MVFADTVEGRQVAKRQPYRALKVRCPRCQEAVRMAGSIIDLGGRWALLCPNCNELSIA
jgi:phage FluMu protein Com